LKYCLFITGLGSIVGAALFLPYKNKWLWERVYKAILKKDLPRPLKLFCDDGRMTSHFKKLTAGVLISLILIVAIQVLESKF
jgi:hypothetical protein